MTRLQRMAALADDVLDMVLGEELITPLEQTVEQHPYLIFYYPYYPRVS